MVSISASCLITLYLPMQIEGRACARQRRQQYGQIDEEATPNESVQKSELNIGQAAKLLKKALIRLTKGTDGKRKGISENQDISIPLQLVGFGAILHIFQLLIRIICQTI